MFGCVFASGTKTPTSFMRRPMDLVRATACAAAFVLSSQVFAAASSQSGQEASATAEPAASDDAVVPSSVVIDGPPPPVPPEVQTRDAEGRSTMRAIRLTAPLTFDGQLDDAVYHEVPPATGFYQVLPDAGEPATEATDVWVMFDADDVYISARLWQADMERTLIANEMRRDRARQNDGFGVAIDTYYDRQTGYLFYTNPLGALGDGQVGEAPGATNTDYNPIWDTRVGRFEGGWTVEMKVPFKSLRYQPGRAQVWGIQFRRVIRHRTETAFFTKMPITVGSGGIGRLSYAATLVGIEAPGGSRNFEIKPYGISRVVSDRVAMPALSNDVDGDFGVDAKYGITQNLTVDLTYNTDFAQVEADDQQVNLTRFNQSFPEKREFFLESASVFSGTGGGPPLFFSRKIGLHRGRPIPILGGARLTGKVGRFSIGALNITTDQDEVSAVPRTNISVLRLRRDILRRSNVGALVTLRSQSLVRPGESSVAYGFDSSFALLDDIDVASFYSRAETPGLGGGKSSYGASFGFNPDLYGFYAEHLFIDDDFDPEVGFVRRDDIRRTTGSVRFSPRPRNHASVRRLSFTGSLDYTLNTAGLLESRDQTVRFETEFHNSDSVTVSGTRNYDLLLRPFAIAPGITVPVGGYSSTVFSASYGIGQQRRYTGNLSFSYGGLFDGDQAVLGFSSGRLAVTPQFSVEPNVSVNWIDLPEGTFTTQLYRNRVTYVFTPRMFVSGFLQYNSTNSTFSTNLRLRWEYSPGSELFIVYTDDQNTNPLEPDRFSTLLNRALVVKVNRLLRF